MSLNGKKILITGGAGFIGSNLVNHLIKEDVEILVIDNLFVGNNKDLSDVVGFKRVDIRSEELKNVINDFEPDNIIHLAAIHYIPYCNANPEETFDVNVMGTRNLLKASEGIKILFSSSAAVYPPLEGPMNENLFGPIDIYGKTKLIGEDLMGYYNPKAIIARFFNVYGPNDTNSHLIPEIFKQIGEGKREIKHGNLTPKRDYIHVDDVCEGLIVLLKHGKSGKYNIGTGKEYSVKEIVTIVSEIIGEEINIIKNENKVRKVEREHLLADITNIKIETGWKPKIDLKTGLKQTFKN